MGWFNHQLSNEKKAGWLGYVGDYTIILPSYIGIFQMGWFNHHLEKYWAQRFLNPRTPGSPKLRMVSWNLKDLHLSKVMKDHPGPQPPSAENMTDWMPRA